MTLHTNDNAAGRTGQLFALFITQVLHQFFMRDIRLIFRITAFVSSYSFQLFRVRLYLLCIIQNESALDRIPYFLWIYNLKHFRPPYSWSWSAFKKKCPRSRTDCENRIMPSITNRFLYCNYFTERVKVLENYKEKLYYRFKETNIRSKIKEGIHMKPYVEEIMRLLSHLEEQDLPMIRKIYTILFQYLERRGRR